MTDLSLTLLLFIIFGPWRTLIIIIVVIINNNKEIQRMWNMKCVIIPVTIGATGIATKLLKKNLQPIPGKHSIGSLQNMDSTAVWNLNPERWESLIQDRYQEEKACDKIQQRNNNNNNNNNNNSEKRTCILIDVAISGDSNVIKKEAEKKF